MTTGTFSREDASPEHEDQNINSVNLSSDMDPVKLDDQETEMDEPAKITIPRPTIDTSNLDSQVPSDGNPKASEAASEDAKLRNVWETSMKDFGLAAKSHRDTVVLLISWAPELDDLHTTEEVNDLEDVFKEYFHYKVIKRQLTACRRPSIQVSKHLVDFVHAYDRESTLLIVYYAGHGIPGKPGELSLAGNRQPHQKHSIRNTIRWQESEHIIRDAEGDVLLIFDCCYAGNLVSPDMRSHWPTRSFEFLAACGRQVETNMPGPKSFTRALIWALKTLVESRKRFTTLELQTKIMNDAPNFPRDQFVPVFERDHPCDQRLVLAPQPKGSDHVQSESVTSESGNEETTEDFLDLRFWYSKRPDEEEINNLAESLKKLIRDQKINARRIGWLGLRNLDGPRNDHIARSAAERWMKLALHSPRRKPAPVPTWPTCLSVDAIPSGQFLHASDTPPTSHSSQSSVSDFQPVSDKMFDTVPEPMISASGDTFHSPHASLAKESLQDALNRNQMNAEEIAGAATSRGQAYPVHEAPQCGRQDESTNSGANTKPQWNQNGAEIGLGDNFELMGIGTRGVLFLTIPKVYPAAFSAVAALSLCACVWYGFSFAPRFW